MKFKSFTKPNDNQNSKDDEIRELMKDLLTDKYEKGFEWKGFKVVAKSVFENSFVYETYTVYFVWNDTQGDHYGEVYIRYYEQ